MAKTSGGFEFIQSPYETNFHINMNQTFSDLNFRKQLQMEKEALTLAARKQSQKVTRPSVNQSTRILKSQQSCLKISGQLKQINCDKIGKSLQSAVRDFEQTA